MVNNFTLVQSIRTLGDPPVVTRSGEIWQQLQDEKLEVSQSLAADPAAALCYECQRASDRKQRFYSL
jgi:hypothetical protein